MIVYADLERMLAKTQAMSAFFVHDLDSTESLGVLIGHVEFNLRRHESNYAYC